MTGGSFGGVALRWASATDTGKVRAVNEDRLIATPPVFAVADGMGGHRAGDRAAELAIEVISERFASGDLVTAREVEDTIRRANEAVVQEGRENPDAAGLGTTLAGVALVMNGGSTEWLAFNVGDSRVYRMVDGTLGQLSRDHSFVQELVDRGVLGAAEAQHHPERNVVTRVLGSEVGVRADYWILSPEEGERFMVCSDGIHGEIDPMELATAVRDEPDPGRLVDRLVQMVDRAGAHDNLSVVVVDVEAVASEPPEDTGPRPAPVRSSAPASVDLIDEVPADLRPGIQPDEVGATGVVAVEADDVPTGGGDELTPPAPERAHEPR